MPRAGGKDPRARISYSRSPGEENAVERVRQETGIDESLQWWLLERKEEKTKRERENAGRMHFHPTVSGRLFLPRDRHEHLMPRVGNALLGGRIMSKRWEEGSR